MLRELIRKLARQPDESQRVCLEVRPDGIAWALSFVGPETEPCGFAECTPAKRLDVLRELVSAHRWDGLSASLVLPLNQYHMFQLERPEGIEDQELADALKWKLKDLLDFSPSDAVADAFDFPEDASRGRGHLVNVVAARRSLVTELIALVQDAELELEKIGIADLALRNLAVRVEGRNRTAALVHLRDRYGQMVICKEGTLYLSRRLDVPFEDLRDAARQENAVQSLALELQRSLDYYESQLGQVPPPVIHVVSRDSSLPLSSMMGSYVASGIEMLDGRALGLPGLDSRCLAVWGETLADREGGV